MAVCLVLVWEGAKRRRAQERRGDGQPGSRRGATIEEAPRPVEKFSQGSNGPRGTMMAMERVVAAALQELVADEGGSGQT